MNSKLRGFLKMVDVRAEIVARVEKDARASSWDVLAAKADAKAYFDREWASAFVELVRVVERLDKDHSPWP